MEDYRTDLEVRLGDVLELLADLLHSVPIPAHRKQDFIELSRLARDLRITLDNKKFGCKTGKHSGTCKCV